MPFPKGIKKSVQSLYVLDFLDTLSVVGFVFLPIERRIHVEIITIDINAGVTNRVRNGLREPRRCFGLGEIEKVKLAFELISQR